MKNTQVMILIESQKQDRTKPLPAVVSVNSSLYRYLAEKLFDLFAFLKLHLSAD